MTGYRFVPIDNRIVKPPVSFRDLHRGLPHPAGSISGMLEVTWEAETPICVGVDDGAGNVSPLEIGGRGVLPGSSLRGMVRTVMEIATFSHLGRINDHRHFGDRELMTLPANEIQAGWLRYCEKKDKWTLTVAARAGRIYPVPFAEVFNYIGPILCPAVWRAMSVHQKREYYSAQVDNWRSMSVHQKREHFSAESGCGKPNLLCSVRFRDGSDYHEHEGTNDKWGEFHTPEATGASRSGYLIVGGAAETNGNPTDRQNEVFIGAPSTLSQHEHTLSDDFMKLFNRVNSNPGSKNWPEPTGLWRYWLGQMNYCKFFTQRGDGTSGNPYDPPPRVSGCSFPGIPVFFHVDRKENGEDGDPSEASTENYNPTTCTFKMGLSRVIKIPYKQGVSDVATRLYDTDTHCFQHGYPAYRVPKLSESFDFARAIFGWTEKDEDKPTAETELEALAGRVAFSPALTSEKPSCTVPKTFVFGAPRESFYRFYLVGDYSTSDGRPAGRKRYPARPVCHETADHNIGDAPAKTKTMVMFHEPGTVYRGRIRLHNLHPVELGALVWCLGFGKVKGPWRHSIGRGKGYGYGCLKLTSLKWRPASLRMANLANCSVPGGLTYSAQHTDFDALSKKFEDYMAKELEPQDVQAFLEHDTIKKLRAYAHPANGGQYASSLKYPSVESFRGIQGPLGTDEVWNPSP